MGNDIYVIPDTQAKVGVMNPLEPIAYHIAEIKPSFLVHLGDHWDMPSLSQYDRGKKSHRVKTYQSDVLAGNEAMAKFFDLLDKLWPAHKDKCTKFILRGNHEHRIDRAKEYGPDELVDLMDLCKPDYTGWDMVIPFLEILKLFNINFCHYFQNDSSARPIGSARQLLLKKHESCIAGHQQGFDYAEMTAGKNKRIQAIIAGSCYYHDEEYKTHTNHHWRGVFLLTDVDGGMFDFNRYSLTSLDQRYFPE